MIKVNIPLSNSVEEVLGWFKTDAYLVGGSVRNFFLKGEIGKDIDIACASNFEDIIIKLKDKSIPYKETEYLNLFFSYNGYDFEITRLRKETVYNDSRHPDKIETITSIEQDSNRRDFTMNALYYHEGIVYDFHNGLKDIENKELKVIGNITRLSEDRLRILRAYRFMGEYNLHIDDTTYQYIQTQSIIPPLSWNIIYPELKKFINSPYRNEILENYPYLFFVLIPQAKKSENFNQYNPYHIYTLWKHTIEVIKHTPQSEIFFWAALFHDLGKIEVQSIDENGIGHYRGHAKASEKISKVYLKNFPIKESDKEYVYKLIRHHDVHMEDNEDFIQKFIYTYSLELTKDILRFKQSDNKAKSDLALYQIEKSISCLNLINDMETENRIISISNLDITPQEIYAIVQDKRLISNIQKKLVYNIIHTNLENKKDILIRFIRSEKYELYKD